eukprot:SAG11_NODE_2015_length_3921_cov_2.436944_2_plen_60_part_00
MDGIDFDSVLEIEGITVADGGGAVEKMAGRLVLEPAACRFFVVASQVHQLLSSKLGGLP